MSNCIEDNQKVKISIIIPMYNVEDYIEECIESVIAQSMKEIEIICINDGSTDSTMERLTKYKNKIILINNKKNRGQSYSRNRGLGLARAEYIYFLDSDDRIERGMLNRLYEEMVDNRLDMIRFGGKVLIEETLSKRKNVTVKSLEIKKTSEIVMTGAELFVELVQNEEFSYSPCVTMWKRESLLERGIKFPEGLIHEDIPWSVFNFSQANRVKVIKDNFFIRRVRENSTITQNYSTYKLYSLVVVLYQLLNYYKGNSNELLEQSLLKVIEQNIFFIRRVYKVLDREEQLMEMEKYIQGSELEKFYNLMLRIFRETKYVDFIADEVLERLGEYQNVYIYGAGEVAIDCLKILSKNDIRVKGFLVSDKKRNPKVLYGHEVSLLSEVKLQDYIILIGTKYSQEEIKQMLQEKGIELFISYNGLDEA